MAARLALFGDIHGNLAAFSAVLKAIDSLGIEDALCAGDIVMRGLEPEQCVAMLRERGWPSIRGNTDVKVTAEPPRPEDHPASSRKGSRSWTIRQLSSPSMAYLRSLPDRLTHEIGGHRVVVVHGDSDAGKTLIDHKTPDGVLAALAADLEADCLVSAHTHVPFVRRVGRLLVVNPGSAGEGTSHDRRPAWGWLEANDSGLKAHLERVERPLARVRLRPGVSTE
jgi:putative phosphoesterase